MWILCAAEEDAPRLMTDYVRHKRQKVERVIGVVDGSKCACAQSSCIGKSDTRDEN
jgi:hypothetical protein